jgi:hypothetical protein
MYSKKDMDKMSVKKHKVYRERAPANGTCLFWSFIFGIKPLLIPIFGDVPFRPDLMNVLDENFRLQVAEYIREHDYMHMMVLNSGTKYRTVEKYCSAIEEGKLWGGDPELLVLSKLCNIFICKIDLLNITCDNCLKPSYYGEDNPLATKCVYIYYNGENHFDPLYVADIKNSNNKQTIFDPNDPIINNILKEFIKKELKCN